ncbi:alkaline phosphatase PhoX [Oceanobacillus sp. CF4.6]|uniref:alkaline phosphatase PhoX n=1 Tax=Oceanobacillus sp. CF4.6 TaxID=3373080 RepID=UPI003EE7DC32
MNQRIRMIWNQRTTLPLRHGGDLWIAEDGNGTDRIIGITPEGDSYVFAENMLNNSEWLDRPFLLMAKLFS